MHEYKIQNYRGGLAVSFYDREGKRRRYSLTATSKKAAAPEAMEIVEEFFAPTPNEITIEYIIGKYLEYLGDRPAGKRLRNSPVLRDYFGPYKPRQITDEIVAKYCATRVKKNTGELVSADTLWTELGGLRDSINYARKRNIIPAEDVPYINRPAKPAPRDQPLTRQEVGKLLKAAEDEPHLYVALILLLGTAGRSSAILELEWDRVDFKENTIDLRVQKRGPRKGRAKVPMNPGLRKHLAAWKEKTSCSHVVCYNDKPIKSFKTAFKSALKKTDLSDVRPHDLRHTAAVWMLQAGSSILRISQYLGHTSIDVTFKVYARYQPDFLRAEAAALDVSDLLGNDDEQGNGDARNSLEAIFVRETDAEVSLVVDTKSHPDLAEYLRASGDRAIESLFRLYQVDMAGKQAECANPAHEN